ncbi:hypothetical protein BDQ17DRAFT_1323599 [Cyathus striatus]|nr:hypothetical protein BDQ17DRAFT_1323599 [Cyathus striatus]
MEGKAACNMVKQIEVKIEENAANAEVQEVQEVWNSVEYITLFEWKEPKISPSVTYHTTQRDNRKVLGLALRELLVVLCKLKVGSGELRNVEGNPSFSPYVAPLVILSGSYFKFKIEVKIVENVANVEVQEVQNSAE